MSVNNFIDEIVENILDNEGLSDEDKLAQITERYKNLLLKDGVFHQAVSRNEKEIRECILYKKTQIENAYKKFNFYNDESVLTNALMPIRLMNDALSLALAFILTKVKSEVSPEEHYIFSEARRLNRSLDEIRSHQTTLKVDANNLYYMSKVVAWSGLALFIFILISSILGYFWMKSSDSDHKNIFALFGLLGGISSGCLVIIYAVGLWRLLSERTKLNRSVKISTDYINRSEEIYVKSLHISLLPLVPTIIILVCAFFIYGSYKNEEILKNTCKLKVLSTNGIPFYENPNNTKNYILIKDGTIIIDLKSTQVTSEYYSYSKYGNRQGKYAKISLENENKEGWIVFENLICH